MFNNKHSISDHFKITTFEEGKMIKITTFEGEKIIKSLEIMHTQAFIKKTKTNIFFLKETKYNHKVCHIYYGTQFL